MTTPPPLPYSPPDAEPATEATRGFGSGKGRVKGIPNKVTLALKEAILRAAEKAGDAFAEAALEKGEERDGGLEGYLYLVATSDPKTFCGLLGKVLPMQVNLDGKLEMVPIITVNAKSI